MRHMLALLWKNSSRKEHGFIYLLLLLMIVAGNLELLGIGLILPIIALLTNPDLIHQNYFLNLVYDFLQPSSNKSFLLMLCALVSLVYLLKNGFLVFLTFFQMRVIYSKVEDFSNQLFRAYIHAPYSFYLNRNSSELLTNFGCINNGVSGILLSLLMFFSETINILLIFGMLFFFTPLITLFMLLSALFISWLMYFPLRGKNLKLGADYYKSSASLLKNLTQAFQGVKELKILCTENYFAETHKANLWKNIRYLGMINLMGQLPRFMIETLLVIGIMLILAAFILSDVANTSIILKLSLIGAATVRLMPSLSRIQYHLATIRQLNFSLDKILNDIRNTPKEALPETNAAPIALTRAITVENLSFSYEPSREPVLKDVSLEIPVNTSMAFVGRTGCGKTTLVDIIAGLLDPTSGRILADGRDIHENLVSWRRQIGYVPQFIHILDDTILANIAFAVPPEKIDRKRVETCLEIAQLNEVINRFPEGLTTIVGENGVKLSGGQRQRLGIARALYHNPKILILDEATSALDNETERAFIEAIATLHGKLTILLVAHRLSTTAGCNQIIRLD
ncbi:MAG: Lipid A export ATP-binding/permease protein MsbA [Lentisphaerae bacterium ADurb.Bin242]|nr:MAG: Lipid A export ATP-binding/permease protein MsbA [Lentisphaerae bacterium ADurb.Bin242]